MNLKRFSTTAMAVCMGLLATVLVTLAWSTSCDAKVLSYNYIEAEYGIDSSVQVEGGDFDSDDSITVEGSYLLHPNAFVWGRYNMANYDLTASDDLWLHGASLGVGFRKALRKEPAETPIDMFALVSYEYLETKAEVSGTKESLRKSGIGAKLGVRAALTKHFEMLADAYWLSYGGDIGKLLTRDGGLDGLAFELGGGLELTDHCMLTATYETGELDYKTIPLITAARDVELDRDEVRLGFRYTF